MTRTYNDTTGAQKKILLIFLTPHVRDRFLPVPQTNSIHYS